MPTEKIQNHYELANGDHRRRIGTGVPFDWDNHDEVFPPAAGLPPELTNSDLGRVHSITAQPGFDGVQGFKVTPAASEFDIRVAPESFDTDPTVDQRALAIPGEPKTRLGKFARRIVAGPEDVVGTRVHSATDGNVAVNAAISRRNIEFNADVMSRSSYYGQRRQR